MLAAIILASATIPDGISDCVIDTKKQDVFAGAENVIRQLGDARRVGDNPKAATGQDVYQSRAKDWAPFDNDD